MASAVSTAPTASLAKTTKKSVSVAQTPSKTGVVPDDKKRKKQQNTDEVKTAKATLKQLMEECLNEKKLLNDFQQQGEKIQLFVLIEKEKRDELKNDLRDRLRQKQDLEEKHAFELKVYKQKVKHLLQEQQSGMADVHIEQESALKMLQDDQRQKHHDLNMDNRAIKVAQKSTELSHLKLINSIKEEQELRVVRLRQDYERRAEELKASFEKRMHVIRETFEEKRKDDTVRIEQKKAKHIAKLMAKHKKAFDDIKKYYRAITHANLELIKSLKEDVSGMRKKEQTFQKELGEVRRQNRKLTQPLQTKRKQADDLSEELVRYEEDQVVLSQAKSQLLVQEHNIKNLAWEHEILEQKLAQVMSERQELRDRLEVSIYDAQQKTGFKNLLLEKKVEALGQDLEKTEAALAEVLLSANMKPETIGGLKRSLEDVLVAKNKQIQKLEDKCAELRQAYAATIKLYSTKLQEHNIPLSELGFEPQPV